MTYRNIRELLLAIVLLIAFGLVWAGFDIDALPRVERWGVPMLVIVLPLWAALDYAITLWRAYLRNSGARMGL